MITIKTPSDFELMAIAGRVVADVLAALEEAAQPGVSMKELDAIAEEMIRARACEPSFLGYHGFPASICASPNEVIVHGIPGDYRLKDGDVLSLDVGAIYRGWHGDAARTFIIGEVPGEVEKLVRSTEQALEAGTAAARPGARLGDIGYAVQTVAEGAGFSVVREYIGHGIGRAMHEDPQVPNYGSPGKGLKLKPGWAICIEPMLNVGTHRTATLDDGWTVVTADGALSAHFENTIAITKDGPKVLTA